MSIKPQLTSIKDGSPTCKVSGTIVGDWHEARTVTATLQKATADSSGNPTGDFTAIGTGVTLVMGQPVFAISGGFPRPMSKTTFQTLGASPSSSSTSSSKPSGSRRILLHPRPAHGLHQRQPDGTTSWLKGSLHMTAGFTLTNNQLSTNPEFLFGPSLSFLRERLFFTVGAYGGFQQALQTGYTLGGTEAVFGTIPTVNQFHWGDRASAISWRVVSASKANEQNPSPTNPPVQQPTKSKPKSYLATGGGN